MGEPIWKMAFLMWKCDLAKGEGEMSGWRVVFFWTGR